MVNRTIPKRIKIQAQSYARYLQDDGLPIEKVFVFGSYAKGTSHKWSDIDVCIISKTFRGKCDPLVFLWRKKRREDTEAMIEPVGFHPKNFVNEDPLVWEIKQNGIELPL